MEKLNREVVNIEEYAKVGKNPPTEDAIYRFRVGKIFAESDERFISGGDILRKVGLEPSQQRLYQKVQGGQRIPVEKDEQVDLSAPGLERFETIPLDPTEGGVKC